MYFLFSMETEKGRNHVMFTEVICVLIFSISFCFLKMSFSQFFYAVFENMCFVLLIIIGIFKMSLHHMICFFFLAHIIL